MPDSKNFLDNNDPISWAILDTLGDPRKQPARYNDAALADPSNDALSKDLTRHASMKAIMDKVDIAAVTEDIKVLLVSLFGAEKVPQQGASITAENVFQSAYQVAGSISDEDAAKLLLEKAAQHGFRYSEKAPASGELIELLDARLNAVVVKHLMGGLNAAIDIGEIGQSDCIAMTDHIMADATKATNPTHISALEKTIGEMIEKNPSQPIIYLSIGCGDGRADTQVMEGLKQKFLHTEFKVLGFDPFQTDPSKNLIVKDLGGHIINRELQSGETFASVVRDITGEQNPVIIATERYALHHMGRSTARLMTEIEGTTLVSVEEPVTQLQRESMQHRLAASGYDILANHAFEVRFGGSWITEARKNPELFGSLYRRTEVLEAQKATGVTLQQVPDIHPATFVITYPPQREVSREWARFSAFFNVTDEKPRTRDAAEILLEEVNIRTGAFSRDTLGVGEVGCGKADLLEHTRDVLQRLQPNTSITTYGMDSDPSSVREASQRLGANAVIKELDAFSHPITEVTEGRKLDVILVPHMHYYHGGKIGSFTQSVSDSLTENGFAVYVVESEVRGGIREKYNLFETAKRNQELRDSLQKQGNQTFNVSYETNVPFPDDWQQDWSKLYTCAPYAQISDPKLKNLIDLVEQFRQGSLEGLGENRSAFLDMIKVQLELNSGNLIVDNQMIIAVPVGREASEYKLFEEAARACQNRIDNNRQTGLTFDSSTSSPVNMTIGEKKEMQGWWDKLHAGVANNASNITGGFMVLGDLIYSGSGMLASSGGVEGGARTLGGLLSAAAGALAIVIKQKDQTEEEIANLRSKSLPGYVAIRLGQTFQPVEHIRQTLGNSVAATGICFLIAGIASGRVSEDIVGATLMAAGSTLALTVDKGAAWKRFGSICLGILPISAANAWESAQRFGDYFPTAAAASYTLANLNSIFNPGNQKKSEESARG